jgi:protein-S-isoprenylcysteine O-methyltransferase Ste14
MRSLAMRTVYALRFENAPAYVSVHGMSADAHRASQAFGTAQTVLLCIFAAAYFFDAGAPLIAPGVLAAAVGAGFCSAGLVLMFMALVALRRAVQIAPEPRAGSQLVTRGVYGRMRHPIYTAILLLVIGLCLRKPTPVAVISGIVVIVFLFFKVRLEERLLLARYSEYADYRGRTWGLVPGFGRASGTNSSR